MLLWEWVEVGCNTQPNRECSCRPDQFVLDLEVENELRRKMRMFEGEVEWFLVGKTIKHVHETSIGMIFISRETNDGFPFSKTELHFREFHLKWITNNCLSLFGGALEGGSLIENGITDNEGIIQRSEDLSKLMKTKRKLIVSNDEGNGNCLVDISNDPNTFVKFKNKYRTNLFVDIQKEIKVDGRKDLANVGVIEVREVDNTAFMKEASLEVLKDGFVFVREPRG
ncbi:hypothetical protein Tco_0138203 [Tanacetum coccineum]